MGINMGTGEPGIATRAVRLMLLLFLFASTSAFGQGSGENQAWVTHGSGSWLEVADNPVLAIPVFTVECWIRVNSTGLIVTRDLSSGVPSDWQLWYENRRLAFITARTPPDSYFFTPDGSIVPGQWHHIALLVNGPDGFAELYIDGQLSIRPEFSSRRFNGSTGLAWGGYFNNSGGAYLDGAIDEGRYWNRLRPINDVRTSMNRRLLLSERNGLIGYWSFCDNFADSSGYGHDLTPRRSAQLEIVTGLPLALSCSAPLMDTTGITWRTPVFPVNPCLQDSLARANAVIHNTGTEALYIQTLMLGGAHRSDFTIMSNPVPARIPPGDSILIPLGFHPGDNGIRNAVLIVATRDSSFQIPLQAAYDGPLISITGQPVHLHSVDGSTVTGSVRVFNLSSRRNTTISAATVAPADDFSILTSMPMTINAGLSGEIEIAYTPQTPGDATASIVLVIDGCLYQFPVTGSGCPPRQYAALTIPEIQGTPGDTILLPLLLDRSTGLYGLGDATIHGSLVIDCHALYPLFGNGGSWEGHRRLIDLEIAVRPASDTVALLPFIVLLGTDSLCALTWTIDSVTSMCPIQLSAPPSDGSVTGFCQEGGTRLFDGGGLLRLSPPYPNPGNGTISVRYSTIERGETRLLLFDQKGALVRELKRHTGDAGEYHISLETIDYPSGHYYLMLRTAHQVVTRRIVILK